MVDFEIERKFLVASDSWRAAVTASFHLRDGLIGEYGGRKVRVRICDGVGSITIKGKRENLARAEFTYAVPLPEAEDLLRTMCDDRLIEKTRHLIPHEGLTWEIDEYHGLLQGIIIAEVELQAADTPISQPDWLGVEVTGDPHYRKVNLLARLAK